MENWSEIAFAVAGIVVAFFTIRSEMTRYAFSRMKEADVERQRHMGELETKLASIVSERDTLEARIDAMELERNDLQHRVAGLESENEKQRKTIELLEHALKDTERRHEEVHARFAKERGELQTRINDLTGEIGDLRSALAQKSEDLAEMREALHQSELARAILESKLEGYERSLEAYSAQSSTLVTVFERLEKSLEAMTSKMSVKGNG